MEAVKGLSDAEVPTLRYETVSIAPFEVTSVIGSFLDRGARVLDVGCGTGAMAAELKRRLEIEIVGIEPNPDRAEAARQAGVQVVSGYYDPTFVKDHGTFDFIILADVIEHLEDPGRMLENLSGSLRKGGRIVASVPNVAHWTVRLELLSGSFEYQPTGLMDATHLRWFTRKSVRQLFERSGFDVEAMVHTAGAWMAQYENFPFSLVPARSRSGFVHKLGAIWPGLFACQNVVSAKLRPIGLASGAAAVHVAFSGGDGDAPLPSRL